MDYLVARLKALGLEPAGPDGGWTQDVPLIRTQVGDGAISVTADGRVTPLAQGRDIYVSTVQPVDRLALANAPMVSVGYLQPRGLDRALFVKLVTAWRHVDRCSQRRLRIE